MKPPPLGYLRASSLAEAVDALGDEDAKVIAGGQSLMPLLSLRLARPTVLVDITDLGLADLTLRPGPDGRGGELVMGATVTQRRLELDPVVAAAAPLLADAVAQVGYPSTRNRGTIGGSLAHADPVAELPAVCVALGGTVTAVGPGGTREVRCEELPDGWFTTTLAPDEILTQIRLPVAGPRHGAAWCEWARRSHDFAEAGVGVAVDLDPDGTCVDVRAAACGTGRGPRPLGRVMAGAGVVGADGLTAALLRDVAAGVVAACGSDADAERAELAGLLAARALARAWGRVPAGAVGRRAA